jgi:hypothetical protein
MKFKVLSDDSVESEDDRIILYSVPRFLDEIANGEGCFICGAMPETKEFNREHVVPDWVLRDRDLHSGSIALPNKGAVMYGRYTVPGCKECNTKMAEIFENPISDAFANGFEGVMDLVRKDGGRLLWHYLALIFFKAHLKHRDLRWHLNPNLGDARIADTYDWTELYHIHCIVRSFHTGAVLEDSVYGSIFVCPATGAEGVLAVMNDSGIVRSCKSLAKSQ